MNPFRSLVAAAAAVGLAAAVPPAGAIDLHVAPDGSDANPGTREKPLATLERARDVVRRELAAGAGDDLTVWIRGGRYELAGPLVFGPADSGTDGRRVTYRAAAGERPVLSGGRPVRDWKKDGDRWTAPATGVGRQLFAGERRLPRARFPKEGYLNLAEVSPDVKTFSFRPAAAVGSLAGEDAELVVLENWSVSRAAVAGSDGGKVTTATPVGWIGHGACTASPGKPAFLEHASAWVERPGEWHCDRRSGRVTLAGDDPERGGIVAPVLERLLVVEGRKDAPVRNLHFVGLGFEHTEFPLPPEGYSEIQAAHYGPGVDRPTFVQPVALQFVHAQGCSVEDARVAHLGASGIGFGAGCRGNRIAGCELEDIGGNGIVVGWRGAGELRPGTAEGTATLDADWKDPADAPVSNEVVHCRIRSCGAVSFGAVGIWVGFSADTRIAHNEIRDLPYTGISVGYRWNTSETSQRRCTVEFNHIHHVMQLLADGGGIYTLGFQPGTALRGNHIHDVARSPFAHGGAPNNGFFLDEGSKGFLIESNIVHGAHGGAVRHNQNRPEWHTWIGNSFTAAPGDPAFPAALAARAGVEAAGGGAP